MPTIHVLILIALWCGPNTEDISNSVVQSCREKLLDCTSGKSIATPDSTVELSACFQKQKYGK
jgi:hypothetical protein